MVNDNEKVEPAPERKKVSDGATDETKLDN